MIDRELPRSTFLLCPEALDSGICWHWCLPNRYSFKSRIHNPFLISLNTYGAIVFRLWPPWPDQAQVYEQVVMAAVINWEFCFSLGYQVSFSGYFCISWRNLIKLLSRRHVFSRICHIMTRFGTSISYATLTSFLLITYK